MRIPHTLVLTVAAAAAVLPAVGCNRSRTVTPLERKATPWFSEKTGKARGEGPSTPEQDAILRVFEADKAQFKGGFDALKPNSQPSAAKAMIASYADHLEKFDKPGCPAEFVAAHARHAKAWRHLQGAVGRLPDAYEGEEFMNSLYALFHDDGMNGRTLGGDVIQAVKSVNRTFAEVFASAEGYGITFEANAPK